MIVKFLAQGNNMGLLMGLELELEFVLLYSIILCVHAKRITTIKL